MDEPKKDAIAGQPAAAERQTEHGERVLEHRPTRERPRDELADRTSEHDTGAPDQWNGERVSPKARR